MPILIYGQMHGAEAATADLCLDLILVYLMDWSVIVATAVMCTCIECFSDSLAARRRSAVVSDGALVGRLRHVPDHLRAAIVGCWWEVDMDAMAGKNACRFDL